MPNVFLTPAELNAVRASLEMMNDMTNDDAFSSLYIQPGSTKTFSSDELRAIREEIEENIDRLNTIQSALRKVGGKTNDKGYAV